VALYALLLGETGLWGRPVRRRATRFLLRSAPAAVAAGTTGLLALRFFSAGPPGPAQAIAGGTLCATLGAVAWRGARRAASGAAAGPRQQLELGTLVLVAAFTAAQLGERSALGGREPLLPLVYLALAVLVASMPRAVGLGLAAFAVTVDAALWWGRGAAPGELPALAVHAAFVALFAVLYHGVLAARVEASRRAERSAVARRLREIEERAREYRLLAPGEGEGGDAAAREHRFAEASVVEIEAAVRGVLEVAEVALRAHTAAFYVLSGDDRELLLRECRSRSDQVARGPLPSGEGPLGGAVKRGAAVRLCGDLRGANHYADGSRPGSLLAVPVVDRRGGHVRGVLLADRVEAVPFGDDDERLLLTLAGELLRAVEAERLLADLKRTRDEKERFYQAIERLNRTAKPPEVVQALLEVAADMVPLDFGAVTLCEPEGGGRQRHRVARCHPPAAEGGSGPLEGLCFADNAGLVSAAVRLGSALPGRELRAEAAMIFDENTRVRGLASLKVLPLRAGGGVLGTLVVGSRRRGALGPEAARQLEVIAMQAADALLRARLFERTETLATTDGLTGLVNHRTFQARLDERLAEARRYGRRLSLILTDIDHFKAVNDTHGHPAGDRVLQGVARVLAREARTTDLVARYGGEEFAIVMPETDAAGALVIAERIRERVAEAAFDVEGGPLRVTLSLGVATFPGDADAKAPLVEAADGCLYAAKRGGRNRTVAAGEARAARRSAPGA
jgi:diguanylate cyclase (GGDEF)-like protein